MRRLYKWWTCLEPLPGETSEQHMKRANACYREHGVPTVSTPEEIEEIDRTVDELLEHLNTAPNTINSSDLNEFRGVLAEVQTKIG